MENKKVVIYCRVSSRKQVLDGNGLESQELKCRAWCKSRGYEVLRVFQEGGVSGAKKDRPAFKEMLSFLENQKEPCIVLVEDLNRWSRETLNHILLKQRIIGLGHSLQSVNMALDDTEESELMEMMSANIAQYERKKNKKRSKSCMVEHVKLGYWIFQPPAGYRRKRVNGKIHLEFDEPSASFLREALEGFANARFPTQRDVVDFLRTKPISYNGKVAKVGFNFVFRLLNNEKYTSCFAYDDWDIPRQKWFMPALISPETFQAIQDRLNGKKTVKPKKYNLNDERFPLRRWVKCACCGVHLTASSPRGKSGKHYPTYGCQGKGCPLHGKSIRQADIHSEFEAILAKITATDQLAGLAKRIIEESYAEQTQDLQYAVKRKQELVASKKAERESALNGYLSAKSDEVRNMCQSRIDVLAGEISALESELENPQAETMPLDEAVGYVMKFITRPLAVWQAGDYYQKQGVLNLCFAEQISYDRVQKFGTPVLSPIFALFSEFNGDTDCWCG